MKMNSVSDITGKASLMLFFATDTGSALTPPVIRVTATVFLVAKTIRSVTETHCFIAKQHCFLKLQHCFATNLICFVARKSSSLNGVALPAPATHCFGAKQYCFFILQHYIDAKQHWFFKKQSGFATKRRCSCMNQHCFVTKTLCSVTMQPSSESRKPCFFPETRCSVTKTRDIQTSTRRPIRQARTFTFRGPSLTTRCCGWRQPYFFERGQPQQFRRIHFVHQIELSLSDAMRTHRSGRQHEAVGRVDVNSLAAVCPNDDVLGSNSLDSLRGRLGPSVGLVDPRCIHLHESTQLHCFRYLRGIGRRMCEQHLQTLLAPLPSQQQVFFGGCVASRQNQPTIAVHSPDLGEDTDEVFHLGQQFPVLGCRDARRRSRRHQEHPRPVLSEILRIHVRGPVATGVSRRHLDDATPSPFDL